MAAFFTASSSQRLIADNYPVTTYPFTVSYWLNMPSIASDQVSFALVDTAGFDVHAVYKSSATNTFHIISGDTGTYDDIATSTSAVNNAWTFIVARFVSATNRRIAVLHAAGAIDHAQGTLSLSPPSLDRMCIGESDYSIPDSPMDGFVAEFSVWNADIQGDGAQLQDSTLRHLAYRGPFSLGHVINNLVEYRALRSGLISSYDRPNESYAGAGVPRPVWTDVNGVTLGKHVQLPGSYLRGYSVPRLRPIL